MSDPQASMFSIMKPYQGFEETYQGAPVTYPIPLTPIIDDQVLVEENSNPSKDYDPRLIRYLPVPIGSTLMLWLPRIAYEQDVDTPELIEPVYRYQLRWRLRSIQDFQRSRELIYSISSTLGAHTSQSGTEPQMAIPACTGEVLTPAIATEANLLLGRNFAGEELSDSQGFYGMVAIPDFPEFVRGPVFFPPMLIPALGNELAIYAYRDFNPEENPTWDFTGYDQGFSLYYGVGSGDTTHPLYTSHGVYVTSLGRATYP